MNKINYVNGDATQPIGDSKKFIVHVCNDVGAWGAGFVLALSKRWKEPEENYRAMKNYILGDISVIPVEDDIYVVNMIAQESTISRNKNSNIPPVRYIAIEKGLEKLATALLISGGSVHMPMIGSGLAGGNWSIIEKIIEVTLCEKNIPVTVYKFD